MGEKLIFQLFIVAASIVLFILIGYIFSVNRKIKMGRTTIKQDIEIYATLAFHLLKKHGYKVSYKIESLGEIDKFISENFEGGVLKNDSKINKDDFGKIIIFLGSFVGEIIRKKYSGKWQYQEISKDAENIINLTIKLKNGTILFPFQKVIKRIENGEEDNLYFYGTVLGKF